MNQEKLIVSLNKHVADVNQTPMKTIRSFDIARALPTEFTPVEVQSPGQTTEVQLEVGHAH